MNGITLLCWPFLSVVSQIVFAQDELLLNRIATQPAVNALKMPKAIRLDCANYVSSLAKSSTLNFRPKGEDKYKLNRLEPHHSNNR